MNNIFVIDGQAGSGKTPLIAEIIKIINKKGIPAMSKAPFTLANQYVVNNNLTGEYPLGIYSYWSKSIESAIFAENLLAQYIDDTIKEVKINNGIIIFDRGWLTICMGILESAHNNENKQKKINSWIDKNTPTFFLDTKPDITQSRNSWNPLLPWTNDNINVDFRNRREYISKYNNVLGRYDVLEQRINLADLANKWSDIIIDYYSK